MDLQLISCFIFLFLKKSNGYPSGEGSISGTADIYTPLSNLGDITSGKITQFIESKSIPINTFPESGRSHAVTEFESLLSKKDSAYGTLQHLVAGVFKPKPVVDTLEEHEKYGNDGDKFRRIGTAVVGGFEGLSNFLNAAVEVPFTAIKQIGKKVTSSLNMVGGKLVGLA